LDQVCVPQTLCPFAMPARKVSFAPCIRRGCPCAASYTGRKGDYCCKQCRWGTPCSRNVHMHPSQPWPPSQPPQYSTRHHVDQRASVNNPTAGQPGGQGRAEAAKRMEAPPPPSPIQLPFKLALDSAEKNLGLCAFYFPQKETACDKACGCSFLGNFYPAKVRLWIRAQEVEFRNAEAAFQALKFPGDEWRFQHLDGSEAFRLKKELQEQRGADLTFGGLGSNWLAMEAVLASKFEDPDLQRALIQTGEAFLLEHNETKGRDTFWSDDFDGTGLNALGLQLMLLREKLKRQISRGQGSAWSSWFSRHLDLSRGTLGGKCEEWRSLVKAAADKLRALLQSHAVIACRRRREFEQVPGTVLDVAAKRRALVATTSSQIASSSSSFPPPEEEEVPADASAALSCLASASESMEADWCKELGCSAPPLVPAEELDAVAVGEASAELEAEAAVGDACVGQAVQLQADPKTLENGETRGAVEAVSSYVIKLILRAAPESIRVQTAEEPQEEADSVDGEAAAMAPPATKLCLFLKGNPGPASCSDGQESSEAGGKNLCARCGVALPDDAAMWNHMKAEKHHEFLDMLEETA